MLMTQAASQQERAIELMARCQALGSDAQCAYVELSHLRREVQQILLTHNFDKPRERAQCLEDLQDIYAATQLAEQAALLLQQARRHLAGPTNPRG